ncbi:MAG: ATP-grasp domain-containing protein, partial [Betaproteobacteria bacterium]|nr:ATP-grasp domain-containing protein [Betaproteobacteria bacterium]
MFTKILIANRGEIACRVIATAKKMGIATVAVYSEADKEARHVMLADEAVLLGPAPSRESYLVADKIIAAAKSTGAQAIHPGYGFLSENEAFAKRCEDEGIAFIGPRHFSIAAMGDKIASKKLANEAKVNTIPGYNDAIDTAEQAVDIAKGIGYPVMIKASAGGGGKGLRVAFNDKEAFEGFTSCRNEARNSFGDDRVFIEKFVEEPRHIEIQVLGDSHGNVIYLNERECSIQRRHQKVIEEAPSPFISDATRKAMGEQAVALAKAVKYQSAGTVEFVVGKDQSFYFLEMNTRLQVEHPVTEAITGIDLVEMMIRVAHGEKLPIMIVHGTDRNDAIAKMREALNGFVIRGISSNIPFQAALLAHPKFVSGDFNTGFIAENYAHGFRAEDVPHDDPDFLVALAAFVRRKSRERAANISGQLPGYDVQIGHDYSVIVLGAKGDNRYIGVHVDEFRGQSGKAIIKV